MKNEETHIIKSQQYEISLENASQSYAYQTRISQVQEHSIQDILEKVMDRYHSPKHLDQYDEIVLDLGTISASNFERELTYKIEESFANFFKKNTHGDTLLKGKRKLIYKTYEAQLLFFLRNGYLQWDVPSSKNPVNLLSDAIKEDKEALVTSLKKEGQKETIRQRLISQFQDPSLEGLVIAVKKEEGNYINQSRRDIVNYQKQYHLVETHHSYFRNAVWEIILAYIFTEVTGYTNQKHFLKYLLRKIAAKYNISYTLLLRKIASGIQKRQGNNSIPNFEKIIFQLQEELPIENDTNHVVEENFTETLTYFLKYNSFPSTSSIVSVAHFRKNVKEILQTNPSLFYTLFHEAIQKNSTHIKILVKYFGDSLTNQIVEKTKDQIFINILAFFHQLQKFATLHPRRSSTLIALEKKIGSIALKTYKKVYKTTEDTDKEFLFQTMCAFVLDDSFVEILATYISQNTAKQNNAFLVFVREVVEKNSMKIVPKDTPNKPVAFQYVQKLYTHCKEVSSITLIELQEQLTSKNYQTVSFKLITTFLAVYAKNKHIERTVLVNWLQERLKELTSKGENIPEILLELSEMTTIVPLDRKIKDIISITQEKYNKASTPLLISYDIEKRNVINPDISINAYQEIIAVLMKGVFYRTQKNMYPYLEEVLYNFSKKHSIKQKELVDILLKNAATQKLPSFLKAILERVTENTKKTLPKEISTQYTLDLVQYYVEKAILPWWGNKTTVTTLQEHITIVLHLYPEKFIRWFAASTHQKQVLKVMSASLYEMLLKQANKTPANNTSFIKQLFDLVLQKDIAGIRNVQPRHCSELAFEFLQYLQKNTPLELDKLITHMVTRLSSIMDIPVHQVYQLVFERIESKTITFDTLGRVKEILLKKVIKPTTYFKEKLQKLETDSSWKKGIASTDSQDMVVLFKTIYQHQPQELSFYLKKVSFRNRIVEQVNSSDQKELILCFFSVADQSTVHTVFEIFKNLRKKISANTYQIVWNHFINKILLKIAISGSKNWTINDWGLLFFTSIVVIKNTLTGTWKEITHEIVITNNIASQKIITAVQELFDKNDAFAKEEKNEELLSIEMTEKLEGAIFIENAGMILLGPYIPMLFTRMGLTENRVFKDEASQQKGMQALQYAVTGKDDFEEQVLLLNKIICGVAIYDPLRPLIPLAKEEKELIDGMLQAIIAQWSTIGNTSVEGLRVSFLNREGSIVEEEKKFLLMVEQKSFDMLLDHIPWSIGQLKLNWMEKLLEITWRT